MQLKASPEGRTNIHYWRIETKIQHGDPTPYLRDWNNFQFTKLPKRPGLTSRKCDLRKPLKLKDSSVDNIYANHVMEHLFPHEGDRFLAETHRVLRPGGICRIVVPDLESKSRNYLDQLEAYRAAPTPKNLARYQWTVADLIDQMVRDRPGGLARDMLIRNAVDYAFIQETCGDVFKEYYERPKGKRGLVERIRNKRPSELAAAAVREAQLILYRHDPRKTLEANRWLYDPVSLELSYRRAGYSQVKLQDHKTSWIPDWNSKYAFDKSDYGDHAFEPSIYMEARKT